MKNKYFSSLVSVFHERQTPEKGRIAGYGAIIDHYHLPVPLPHRLALISLKNRQYKTEHWQVFTSRHQPEDSLYKQLVFALKYEGINLLVFKKLFEVIPVDEVIEMIQSEPLGQYSRKTWFLYEWLTNEQLNVPDLASGNFVPLIDEKIQYAIGGTRSSRHRIVNNLPGNRNFCPLIYRSAKLEQYVNEKISEKQDDYLGKLHKDLLMRASAFLMLKDSKASFTIEGEHPPNTRAVRWGKAVGEAGLKPLSREELLRLQRIIIESSRFTKMGFRRHGGFVGEHDRITGEPLPEHISARWQDIETLMGGLIETDHLLEEAAFDAVLAATVIAFGFVFIHPFVDGNGRIHRYLVHHVLARKRFSQQGVIFPVSASILDHIEYYRKVLELYSHPLLNIIKWVSTADHNVVVVSESIDYYRYFDATMQAEFLYDCVYDTINSIIPNEIKYIQNYDSMKRFLDDHYEMPDKTVALLIRYLDQNKGKLSQKARKKAFKTLNDKEVDLIEKQFMDIFLED